MPFRAALSPAAAELPRPVLPVRGQLPQPEAPAGVSAERKIVGRWEKGDTKFVDGRTGRADASLLSGVLVERQIFLCQCFFVSSPRRQTRLELPRPAVAAWLSPLATNIALILLQRGSKARPGGGCEDGFRFEMVLAAVVKYTGH